MLDEPVAPPQRRVDAGALARAFVRSPALAPCTVAVAVFIGWAGYQAGYPPTVWYPGGLLLGAALATALMIGPRPVVRAPRPLVAALGLFAGFTAWSYLSILWADQRADAWDGANRTLLYLVVYALFALWSWRPAAAASLMALYAVGVTAVMGVYLARAARAVVGDGVLQQADEVHVLRDGDTVPFDRTDEDGCAGLAELHAHDAGVDGERVLIRSDDDRVRGSRQGGIRVDMNLVVAGSSRRADRRAHPLQ